MDPADALQRALSNENSEEDLKFLNKTFIYQ